MDRLFFVVNPIAGSGRSTAFFEAAREIMDKKGVEYGYAVSEGVDHARKLALKAIDEGEKTIISVGGDGTMREVACALMERRDQQVTLGFLPAGSGNDLCTTLNIPKTVPEAMELILTGKTRRMDAAMANEKCFFNVAGMGFDVDVLIQTEKYKKKLNGMLPYFLGIVSAIKHLKRYDFTYIADGERKSFKGILFCAANGKRFGGGMLVAPLADPFDGKFDICSVRDIKLPTFLKLLPGFLKGKHIHSKPVDYYNAGDFTLECAQECKIELDGEIIEKTPVTFRLFPGALNVITP